MVDRRGDASALLDRISVPVNVVVSNLVVPDVPSWWGGSAVSATYPAGPVAHGVGLNVTALDYQDVVTFGLVCPRPVPDVGDVAAHLYDALAEHVRAAADDLGR